MIDKNFHINFSPLYFAFVMMLLMLWASEANAQTEAKIGGVFVNSDDRTVTATIDHSRERKQWQRIFEFDYVNKDSGDKVLQKMNTNIKFNYTFKSMPKHYVITQFTYDYDKTRPVQDRLSTGLGWGYKLLRTSRFKASNELSIARLETEVFNEVVIRDSLWLFYDISDKIRFVNKFLYESGDKSNDYYRNETGFDYVIEENFTIGIANVYTKDPIENNVLNINFGVRF